MRGKLKERKQFYNAVLQKAQRYSPKFFQRKGEVVRKGEKNGDRTGRGIVWKRNMGEMRERNRGNNGVK
jgi:hypothetical protein